MKSLISPDFQVYEENLKVGIVSKAFIEVHY